MSNKGKWDRWCQGLREVQAYGDTVTYEMGGEFLRDCSVVEDWGAGKGWFKKFVPQGRYRGIDGSHTPFAEKIVDLVEYTSVVPGIYMRHVLEHNYQWQFILANALRSFTERMVLVLFTPLSDTTHEIAYADDPGVPDISFSLEELLDIFKTAGLKVEYQTLETATQYGVETVFFLEKSVHTNGT
jgi:hypothetical protein